MSKVEIHNITAGVVIIDKKNNVLVEKRNSNESLFPNLYSIPAGKLILGETLEETAKREVNEEVNISLEEIVFVNTYFWDNNALFVYAARVDSFEDIGKSHKEVNDLDFAPNIKKAITDALSIELIYFQNVSIEMIIQESLRLIVNNKIEINGKIGWDHFLFQKRIGILGSALGLCILKFNKKDIEGINPVYQTLLSFQKSDGGWGIRGADNESSIVECTCYCLKALFNKKSKVYNSEIIRGMQWLIENRLKDYSWGVNNQSMKGRTTPTCLAIETLWMLGEVDFIKNSIEWLFQNKNSDGGWGFNVLSQSCYSATSSVINLLSNIDAEKYYEHINAASNWLQKQIKTTIITDESEQEYINETRRFEFKHSTKVKVVKALILTNKSLFDSQIHCMINEIINYQNDNGAWEHSLTPNLFPIWHLYDIIDLLYFIKEKYKVNSLLFINKTFDQLRIQKSLIDFVNKNIPQKNNKTSGTRFT